ncbi:MAG: tetratricopeptide repeat protein [Verrucomicrobia bacterium]|nr:tetratricopeptide repeat protein [Verrucomicrobiota bacterium]
MIACPHPAAYRLASRVLALLLGLAAAAPNVVSAANTGWFELQRIKFKNQARLQKAGEAIAQKNYGDAAEHLSAALENDPKNPKLMLQLIGVYDQLERWDDGIALCDSLVAQHPDHVNATFCRADMAIKAGRRKEARLSLEKIAGMPPQTMKAAAEKYGEMEGAARTSAQRLPEVYRTLAEMCMQDEAYDQAESYGSRWLAAADSAEAHAFLSEVGIRQEKWAAALKHLDVAIKAEDRPENLGMLSLKKGTVLTRLEDYERASEALAVARANLADKALIKQVDAQLLGNERRRASPYFKLGQYAKARDALKGALTLSRSEAQTLSIRRQLARTYFQLGEFEPAIAEFDTVLKASFNEDDALAVLSAHAMAAQWQRGAKAAQGFLSRDGLSENFSRAAREQLMHCFLNLEQHMPAYKLAVALHEEFLTTNRYILDRAVAAQRVGRTNEAFILYQDHLAHDFNPDDALKFHFLLKEAARPGESEKVLSRILAVTALPKATVRAARYELAQTYQVMGRTNDYISVIVDLLADGVDAKHCYSLAVQLGDLGQNDMAIEMYAKSLAAEDDNARRFEIAMIIANLYIGDGKTVDACKWFDDAVKYGTADLPWYLGVARYPAWVSTALPCCTLTAWRNSPV